MLRVCAETEGRAFNPIPGRSKPQTQLQELFLWTLPGEPLGGLPAPAASPASSPTPAPGLLLRDTFPFTQALWDGFVAMAMHQSGEGEGEREQTLVCGKCWDYRRMQGWGSNSMIARVNKTGVSTLS